jgi:hypothetical protein
MEELPKSNQECHEQHSSNNIRQVCKLGSPEQTGPPGIRRGSTRIQCIEPSFVLVSGSALLRLCWRLRTSTARTTMTTTKSPPQTLMITTQKRAITAIPSTPSMFLKVTTAPTQRRWATYGFSFRSGRKRHSQASGGGSAKVRLTLALPTSRMPLGP